MVRRSVLLLAMAAVLAGCASAGGSPGAGATRTRHSQNVITEEELSGVNEGDLYSAIQRLRPNFLVTRGQTSLLNEPGIVVYMDNTRLGDLSTLRQIQVSDVKQVQYFSASEATQRYGTGTPNGAILVIHK